MRIIAEKTTEKTLTTNIISENLHEALSTFTDGPLTQTDIDDLDQRGLIDYVTYKLCTHYLNNGYTLHYR